MTSGYFYIAINDSSIGALVVSAKRLREVDPNHPIAVATDCELSDADFAVFDKVIFVPSQIDIDGLREMSQYPHQGFMGKCRYFYKSPWDVTIFLDNDVYAAERFDELFDAADVYDMAGSFCSGHHGHEGVPEYFTMINTGVIMYRKCEAVEAFMNSWWVNLMAQFPDPFDQSPFQLTLWQHRKEIKFLTLPYEYNFRFIFPMYAWGPVKIMHGRFDGVAEAAIKINSITHTSRVWYWDNWLAYYDVQKGVIRP
jgi:hypothetical protein